MIQNVVSVMHINDISIIISGRSGRAAAGSSGRGAVGLEFKNNTLQASSGVENGRLQLGVWGAMEHHEQNRVGRTKIELGTRLQWWPKPDRGGLSLP